jgi:hypothetical protein
MIGKNMSRRKMSQKNLLLISSLIISKFISNARKSSKFITLTYSKKSLLTIGSERVYLKVS